MLTLQWRKQRSLTWMILCFGHKAFHFLLKDNCFSVKSQNFLRKRCYMKLRSYSSVFSIKIFPVYKIFQKFSSDLKKSSRIVRQKIMVQVSAWKFLLNPTKPMATTQRRMMFSMYYWPFLNWLKVIQRCHRTQQSAVGQAAEGGDTWQRQLRRGLTSLPQAIP